MKPPPAPRPGPPVRPSPSRAPNAANQHARSHRANGCCPVGNRAHASPTTTARRCARSSARTDTSQPPHRRAPGDQRTTAAPGPGYARTRRGARMPRPARGTSGDPDRDRSRCPARPPARGEPTREGDTAWRPAPGAPHRTIARHRRGPPPRASAADRTWATTGPASTHADRHGPTGGPPDGRPIGQPSAVRCRQIGGENLEGAPEPAWTPRSKSSGFVMSRRVPRAHAPRPYQRRYQRGPVRRPTSRR